MSQMPEHLQALLDDAKECMAEAEEQMNYANHQIGLAVLRGAARPLQLHQATHRARVPAVPRADARSNRNKYRERTMIDKTQRLAVLMQSEANKLPGEWGGILKAAGIIIEHQHDKIEGLERELAALKQSLNQRTSEE